MEGVWSKAMKTMRVFIMYNIFCYLIIYNALTFIVVIKMKIVNCFSPEILYDIKIQDVLMLFSVVFSGLLE